MAAEMIGMQPFTSSGESLLGDDPGLVKIRARAEFVVVLEDAPDFFSKMLSGNNPKAKVDFLVLVKRNYLETRGLSLVFRLRD